MGIFLGRLLFILSGLLLACPASAVPAKPYAPWAVARPEPYSVAEPPVMVVVLVPAVSLDELTTAPAGGDGIRRLLSSGAVGLMNARTGANMLGRLQRPLDSLVQHPEETRPTTLESGCLSLGAGTRCFTRDEGGAAFEADEPVERCPARALWAQRTGAQPGEDSIYQVCLPRLAGEQRLLPYPAEPGALGQALRDAGVVAAVVGNADDATGPHREAACLAMDRLGRVPLGKLGGDLSVPDLLAPGGRRTNPEAVVRAVGAVLAEGARFIVVETGDTARVDRGNEEIRAAVRPLRRREAIQSADRIVAGILDRLDPASARIILLAPTPSLDEARGGDFLSPVVIAGAEMKRGLLTSPSTRTPGLVTNTDVAATILQFFKAPVPAQVVGRPIEASEAFGAAPRAIALEREWQRVEDYARPLGRSLAWGQVFLVAGLILLAWAAPEARGVLRLGGLLLAAVPAVVLLLGLFSPRAPLAGAGLFLALLGALVLPAWLLRRRVPAAGCLWAFGGALALYDLLTHDRILRASPLGYSPFSGARYYGIGNEGFGLLLPGLLLGILLLSRGRARAAGEWGRREILLILGAAVILAGASVLVGHPLYGANFGGMLAGAVTAAAAGLLALRGRVRLRSLLLVAAGAAVVVALPLALEMHAGAGGQSHIGRALASLRAQGFGALVPIAARKIAMNARLLRNSPWSRLLLVGGIGVGSLALCCRGRLRAERPELWAGVVALLWGAGAALVLNDSGVQPASEMVTAAAAALVLWMADNPAIPAEKAGGR